MQVNMILVGKMLMVWGFVCFLCEAKAQKAPNNPSLCFYNYYYGDTNDKDGSFKEYSKCNLEGYRAFKAIIQGTQGTQEEKCAKAVDALFYIDPVWASYAKVTESKGDLPVTVRGRVLDKLILFCLNEVYNMMYKDDGKTQRSLFSGLNSDWKSAGLPPSTDSNAVKGRKLRFLLLKAAYPMDNKKAFKPIMPILLSPYLSEVYYRKSDIMRYYNAVKGNGTISEDNNKRAQNILLPILFRKNMDAVHKPDYFRLRINGNDQQRISRYGRKFEHLFRTDAFFKKKKAKCSYYFVKNIKENITYGNWMTDTKDNIDKTDNYYFHWCMSGYFLAGVNKMSHNQFDLDKLELYSLDKKYLYPFNSWEQFAKMKGDEIKRVKKFNNAVAVKKYLNKTRISRKDFVFRCRNFGGEHANKTTLTKRCVAHFIREKAIREWATRIETVYTDSYAK